MTNRPSLRNVFANWKGSDLPLPRRLQTFLANNWTKARTRSHCCGHPGEPGC